MEFVFSCQAVAAVTVMSGAEAPSACITLTENTEIERERKSNEGRGREGKRVKEEGQERGDEQQHEEKKKQKTEMTMLETRKSDSSGE